MSLVEIAHPWWAAGLIALVILLLLIGRRDSLVRMNRTQRLIAFGSRVVLLTFIILALADIRLRTVTDDLSVLFLLDGSRSVSSAAGAEAQAFISNALRSKTATASAGVATFGREARVIAPLAGATPKLDATGTTVDGLSTDIGHALDFAAAVLPAEGARRVVLLSDGNDTEGRAVQTASRLSGAGIELWTVPLRNEEVPEVLLERIDVPQQVKLGEPFDLTAIIRSNCATSTTVKLYQNQFLIQQREIQLSAGRNEFRAENVQADGGFISYEIELLPAQDTQIENNRAVATTTAKGEPRVLLVESSEKHAAALVGALRTNKIAVETRASAGAPRTLEDLQQFDLFILSDIPALQLTRQQMELYQQWVQDFGGGFVMLGGENSYGAGGYYQTPIERMLPVRMEHEDRQDTPGVALLVILDRSGSMTAQVQGQTKMSLANQGAVFAMNALQPRDQFGVLAVDTRAHTVTPLAPLSDKAAAEQRIMSVTGGGGGIYVYTSLAEAFQALRDAQARIKHVILFSDASDAEEKIAGEMNDSATPKSGGSALDLASAMLSARITTSVVALGSEQDKDTAFLRTLAERGSGRFYLTSDATTLPQIFSTETMKVAQSSIVEEPFLAVPVKTTYLTDGVNWKDSPLLLGYNSTKLKPSAEMLLATEQSAPLLASWRYGLGQAAAFTSDAKDRWAAEWLQWPGYGKFWSQVVRGLMRKSPQENLHVATREHAGGLELSIDAVTATGAFRNRLDLQVSSRSADGRTHVADVQQDAPGHYSARVPLTSSGTTILSVTSPQSPDAGVTIGHSSSYPEEFLKLDADEQLLRDVASHGGRYSPSPEDVFASPQQSHKSSRSLTPWFLAAALLLLPLDIWLRRRSA